MLLLYPLTFRGIFQAKVLGNPRGFCLTGKMNLPPFPDPTAAAVHHILLSLQAMPNKQTFHGQFMPSELNHLLCKLLYLLSYNLYVCTSKGSRGSTSLARCDSQCDFELRIPKQSICTKSAFAFTLILKGEIVSRWDRGSLGHSLAKQTYR